MNKNNPLVNTVVYIVTESANYVKIYLVSGFISYFLENSWLEELTCCLLEAVLFGAVKRWEG